MYFTCGFVRRHAGISQRCALIDRRKECRTPVVDAAKGQRRADRDKGRQILVLGSQSVADPRAHAGPHEIVAAGMQLHHRAAMSRVGAVDRMQHAQIVDMRCEFREQLADPQPALAVLLKLPGRLQQVAGRVELHSGLANGSGLPSSRVSSGLDRTYRPATVLRS